jgi:enoyl-[acyl-carrier protein] reductase II
MLIDLVLKEKVDLVVTEAGDPRRFTEVLRKNGIRVLHVVSTVKQAQSAESCGVDAVIAAGVEAAAHHGFHGIPLFSLIPQVVDAVSIPVIAAGDIVDSRGLVAAFALGAEGVQMGTRWIAEDENIAYLKYKQTSAGLINEILPVVRVIQRLVGEYNKVIKKIS